MFYVDGRIASPVALTALTESLGLTGVTILMMEDPPASAVGGESEEAQLSNARMTTADLNCPKVMITLLLKQASLLFIGGGIVLQILLN